MNRGVILLALCAALHMACGSHTESALDAGVGVLMDAEPNMGWRTIASVGNGPIQEIGVTALNDKLYIVGGFDETLQIGSSVQVYDPEQDRWSNAAPLPVVVHHANLAAVDGKLYVVGAMQLEGFSFTAIGHTYQYDPTQNQWFRKSDMPAGTERGASAVGVIAGKIIVAGGLRDGAVSDVSSYDPATDTWDDSLPNLPAATDHLVGASVGENFYAIGGRSGGIEDLREQVLVYNSSRGNWQEAAPMLTPRGGAAAGVLEGKVIVVGGEGDINRPSGVFSEVESYDPLADAWTSLEPMLTPRHGMAAAAIGDSLYVPGGATKQGFGAVATAEAFRP